MKKSKFRKEFENWIFEFFSSPNGYWTASEEEIEKYTPSDIEIQAWWGDSPSDWENYWKEIADWYMVGD